MNRSTLEGGRHDDGPFTSAEARRDLDFLSHGSAPVRGLGPADQPFDGGGTRDMFVCPDGADVEMGSSVFHEQGLGGLWDRGCEASPATWMMSSLLSVGDSIADTFDDLF